MAIETYSKSPKKTSCQYVKGVGPKRAILLERLGIKTVEDLIYTIPRRYEDRSRIVPIGKLIPNSQVTVCGKIISKGIKKFRKKRRMEILEMAVQDPTGTLFVVWFNQGYLYERFQEGDFIVLSGKVVWYQGLQLRAPEYEILAGDDTDQIHTGRIVPFYPLTENLTHRGMRLIMRNVLDNFLLGFQDILPASIKDQYQLMDLLRALEIVHYPRSMEELEHAKKRLILEEFLLIQLAIEIKRRQVQKLPRLYQIKKDRSHLEEFTKSLPFTLTGDQQKVIQDIFQDLTGRHPMNRLLQGDVGSGKTLVACAALYLCAGSDYQGVLMVPSEVLAVQHYNNLTQLFSSLGVKIGLLVGDMKKSDRLQILDDLITGKIHILVGTHAILEDPVQFNRLGLIVIDEQHKFGVSQRHQLRQKSQNADVLVMTATPIPRTLCLTLYGDLDISVIREMPPGRGKTSTHWIKESKLNEAYEFIRKQVREGRQAFIIYPLVEESDKIELKAVYQMIDKLAKDIFPELKLGVIHGRLSACEKNQILQEFRMNQYQILVSTTVIEVGIDIPNATVMLIENAERFGLAGLHQLRGRIGRGSYRSYCVLEANPKTEEGVMRIKAMVETQDGFDIAERDLSIRGPGEILGTRQHGIPELRVANLIRDISILEESKKIAKQILINDPQLIERENLLLKKALQTRFTDRVQFAQVG